MCISGIYLYLRFFSRFKTETGFRSHDVCTQCQHATMSISPSLTKILLPSRDRTGQSCKFRMDEVVTRRCDSYVHFTEDATLRIFSDGQCVAS